MVLGEAYNKSLFSFKGFFLRSFPTQVWNTLVTWEDQACSEAPRILLQENPRTIQGKSWSLGGIDWTFGLAA